MPPNVTLRPTCIFLGDNLIFFFLHIPIRYIILWHNSSNEEATTSRSSIFLRIHSLSLSSPSVTILKRSGEILVPWGKTLYLNLPFCKTILNRLLYSSGRQTWWNPEVRSNTAKYLESAGILLTNWLLPSLGYPGLFRILLRWVKSVTRRTLVSSPSFPPFLTKKPLLLQMNQQF